MDRHSPEERKTAGHISARMLGGWYAVSEYEQRRGEDRQRGILGAGDPHLAV